MELAVDLATPWFGMRRVLRPVPLDTTHIPERFASFTIIVLGEIGHVIITGVAADKALPLISIIVWVFAAMTLKLVSVRHVTCSRILLRILVAGSILALTTFGTNLPPLVLLGAFVIVVIIFVIFEMSYWSTWSKMTQATFAKNEKQSL